MAKKNFSLISDYDQVAGINISIRHFLEDENVEQHICNGVEICLTEALNNVIKHSYKGEQSCKIDVNVAVDSKLMEIQIVDEGESRKNLEIKELDFDPNDIDSLPESGMGLYIIKQLMDELDYYKLNGKNCFVLRKYLL
ncbi:MAG: anti-sigma regulatory factor serine/threonine protein kinase [Ignavibacteria bacterium]|nr:MAG: anti-sigma regulatory factor serine/threonine protein kinase [Ignavibacteria bacterium]KAF0161013.1 MAG: anti-sigma regulatory factor serine/threonine protein kinase [Ignavibacteria bacterium]